MEGTGVVRPKRAVLKYKRHDSITWGGDARHGYMYRTVIHASACHTQAQRVKRRNAIALAQLSYALGGSSSSSPEIHIDLDMLLKLPSRRGTELIINF